ncbi:MAG TPA: hypothetical protein PK639_01485 [Candidatus Woesebacteria bacterium]|nr:hypothetical protein [Candidatus Woesebacteria bacterium]
MPLTEIKKHPYDFLLLAIILLGAVISFFIFSYEPHYQRRIIYLTSFAYLAWSLFHHYRKGDLHLSIIIEYLALILLAVVITTSTLF